eukprot:TRINITY_DN5006_c0_g1_i1.p1 TRINITY_DN5006_c0_g1~~TRINITY_DN5006_c0_g1_i1.p1  ORF type:complete len:451 (+),score=61.76 TRINITY_DN5006_c0_g1_i1:92-1444(+)
MSAQRRVVHSQMLHAARIRAELGINDNVGHNVSFPHSFTRKLSHLDDIEGNSGYLKVDNSSNSALFFVFYKALGPDTQRPLVVWLNGGPGCSSLEGLFYGIGPFYIEGMQEKRREVTWLKDFHLLFIDQPVGTGLSYAESYGNLARDCKTIGRHFDHALQEFYSLDTFAWLRNVPVHLFGESYAGKYIPCIAKTILENQQQHHKFKISLSSLGIGNGWTHPPLQGSVLPRDAFFNSLIDTETRLELESLTKQVSKVLTQGNHQLAVKIDDMIVDMIIKNGGDVNMYNRRLIGQYVFGELDRYGVSSEFRMRYGIPTAIVFRDCDDMIYESMAQDMYVSEAETFEKLLEQLPILFYSGRDDLIVPTSGTEEMLSQFKWSGAQSFSKAPTTIWKGPNGKVYGKMKSAGNLWLALVDDAGHMVPMEKPASALDMVRRFIAKQRNWDSNNVKLS